jgi:hypothetical protein
VDTYYASVAEVPVGANKNLLSVFNATGSGKKLYVFRLMAVGSPTAAVVGLKITLAALRFNAEHSGGTTDVFAKADPASPNVPAQITMRHAKAVALTVPGIEAIAFGLGNVNSEETSPADPGMLYKAPDDPSAAGGSAAVICSEGTGFVIRQLTLAGAGAISLVAEIGLA